MTTYFKHIAQIQSRSDYDKVLRTALSKPGQEAFHFFDAFPFDKKEAPLVLVGDVGKPLLADLKKAAPKAQYATGTCTVTAKDELVFDRTAGKLQIKELTAGLRLSGLKNVVKLAGDEDEGGEGEAQEPPPSGKPTGGTPAKTVKPGVPTPSDLAKVQLKPTPQVKKPVAPQDPALAKQWQDKVKILRPAYELALKKAQAQDGGTWAEDLEGSFEQMVHEAKSGDFAAALATLGRLARMIKSEEAARAEAKHQTMRENQDFREATSQSTREMLGEEGAKEQRRFAKASGLGLTDDGHVNYARAYTAQEWKAQAIDPLAAVKILLSGDQPDLKRFQAALERASLMVHRAVQHTEESEGRHPERNRPIGEVEDAFRDLEAEASRLLMNKEFVHTPEQLVDECEELSESIQRYFVERAPRGKVNEQQLLAFKRESNDRLKRWKARMRSIEAEVQEKERDLLNLQQRIDREKLPKLHAVVREATELEQEIEKIRQMMRGTHNKYDPNEAENRMVRLFQANVQDPEKVLEVQGMVDRIRDLVEAGAYDDATKRCYNLTRALGFDGSEEGPAQNLNASISSLTSNLHLLRETSAANVKTVVALAERAKTSAEQLLKVLG